MRKIATIISAVIVFVIFCSQDKDKSAGIKAKYLQINHDLKTFSKQTREDEGESTDGGTITAYYKGKQLKVITAEYLGETGKRSKEYFFDEGCLIFVLDKEFDYNRPYYWDKKMAKENDDTEWYDYKKTKIKINRFYFSDGRMLEWVNDKNIVTSIETAGLPKNKSDMLHEALRLKKLFD